MRAALLGLQRAIGARGRVVAEGRDTGTVVFPDALAKFFLTAIARERARRRAAGAAWPPGARRSTPRSWPDMELRDARDSTRAVAPLTPGG